MFNFCRHWGQLLLRNTGDAPVIFLVQEGVTQSGTFLMVLYGITLATLTEELRYADPTLLSPLYANDATFGGSAR